MKRLCTFLLIICLCLSLASCGKEPAPESNDAGESAQSEPLVLDAFRVEFVVGERDVGELMKLKSELPPLLTAALAEEGVEVKTLEVTFGTSADATVRAVKDGGVDLAFTTSEAYLENRDALQLLALEAVRIPAEEKLTEEEIANIDGIEQGSVFYQEAVVLSANANTAVGDAVTAALLHLCTDADGNAALQCYGTASYLTTPDLDVLLEPYRAYLTQLENKE